MHERSLLADLMRKLEDVARQHGASRITRVQVRLGALSHISPEHFREHFAEAARGTVAEGAVLDIQVSTDLSDPHAQDILIESVESVEIEDADS